MKEKSARFTMPHSEGGISMARDQNGAETPHIHGYRKPAALSKRAGFYSPEPFTEPIPV